MSLFDPPPGTGIELLPCDGSAVLYLEVVGPKEADRMFHTLVDEIAWRQNHLRMFGRVIPEPRLVSWIGDPEASYSYSGIDLSPSPWTPALTRIRRMCEQTAATTFNSVLANLYRDGSDSVDWHSDDEPELGHNPVIASLSLGATRRFDLRHKDTKERVSIELPAGSVVVMSGGCQTNWAHRVAKTKKATQPRINLTFRTIAVVDRPTNQSMQIEP